jgi:hypothetical protein
MIMLVLGILIGVVLTIAVEFALFIVSVDPELGEEYDWRRY